MGKLKKHSENKKISRASIEAKRGGSCPQYPAFSFLHLTSNSAYNIDFFNHTMSSQRNEALYNLYCKLQKICCMAWRDWLGQKKQIGCELIPSDQLRFEGASCAFTPDEKVYIFRFKTYENREGRIIGFRKESCPTLFIIGYDFEFSAYPH